MFENRDELVSGTNAAMRDDALKILRAGIDAVEPYRSIMDFVTRNGDAFAVIDKLYDLDQVDRIIVLGGGKAAIAMVTAIVDLLGDMAEGHVNALEDRTIGNVVCHRATHPIPGPEGVEGSRLMFEAAMGATERDLVICLISGGGSALMPLPEEGLTLEHKMEMTNILLKCGATIQELNCIRKHMSAIKGGKLARAAAPAPVTSLILSDVIGDPLDSIASGPTAPDTTSYEDARAILDKYDVWDDVPDAVREELEAARFEERPRGGGGVPGYGPRVHRGGAEGSGGCWRRDHGGGHRSWPWGSQPGDGACQHGPHGRGRALRLHRNGRHRRQEPCRRRPGGCGHPFLGERAGSGPGNLPGR